MATKPATKVAVKPTTKGVKYYYSVLRRLPYNDSIPLEDNEVWGPFDSHEAVVKDWEENFYPFDDGEGVGIIVFENPVILSLKEKREVIVTKTSL